MPSLHRLSIVIALTLLAAALSFRVAGGVAFAQPAPSPMANQTVPAIDRGTVAAYLAHKQITLASIVAVELGPPGIDTGGRLISMVNHTDSELLALRRITSVSSSAITLRNVAELRLPDGPR